MKIHAAYTLKSQSVYCEDSQGADNSYKVVLNVLIPGFRNQFYIQPEERAS